MPDEFVTFDHVECTAQTNRAILVHVDGEKVWIPQSQIHDDSEVWGNGDSGKLVISEWIARRKGLL